VCLLPRRLGLRTSCVRLGYTSRFSTSLRRSEGGTSASADDRQAPTKVGPEMITVITLKVFRLRRTHKRRLQNPITRAQFEKLARNRCTGCRRPFAAQLATAYSAHLRCPRRRKNRSSKKAQVRRNVVTWARIQILFPRAEGPRRCRKISPRLPTGRIR